MLRSSAHSAFGARSLRSRFARADARSFGRFRCRAPHRASDTFLLAAERHIIEFVRRNERSLFLKRSAPKSGLGSGWKDGLFKIVNSRNVHRPPIYGADTLVLVPPRRPLFWFFPVPRFLAQLEWCLLRRIQLSGYFEDNGCFSVHQGPRYISAFFKGRPARSHNCIWHASFMVLTGLIGNSGALNIPFLIYVFQVSCAHSV